MICPISLANPATYKDAAPMEFERERCAWWVRVNTINGSMECGCSMSFVQDHSIVGRALIDEGEEATDELKPCLRAGRCAL